MIKKIRFAEFYISQKKFRVKNYDELETLMNKYSTTADSVDFTGSPHEVIQYFFENNPRFKNIILIETESNLKYDYMQCEKVDWDNMTFTTEELPLNAFVEKKIDLNAIKYASENASIEKLTEWLFTTEPAEVKLLKTGEKNLDQLTVEEAKILTRLGKALKRHKEKFDEMELMRKSKNRGGNEK